MSKRNFSVIIQLAIVILSGRMAIAAVPDDSGICLSAPELRKTYEFLRKESDLGLPISRQLEIAKQVSAGCADSFERFSKAYTLMKKSGVDLKSSLKTGIMFAAENAERSRNFFEFFQMTYLKENFDLDFEKSFELALHLSKDFVGNPTRARSDFEKTVEFCQKKSGLSLPIKKCAEISIQVAKMSPHFSHGSFSSFEETYSFLRQNSLLELTMKEALETSLKVLSYGPAGPTNFKESFRFAMDSRHGLALKSSQALQFSLEQAKASNKTAVLPVYE